MSNRKSVLMMKIVSFVATPEELKEVEALYARGKGPAHHKILRILERYFETKARSNAVNTQEKNVVDEGFFLKKITVI